MTSAAIYKWGAGIAGGLLAFAGNFVWSEVAAHGSAIDKLQAEKQSDHDLLQEVRQDVKEIRDSIRRVEGSLGR